MEQKTAEWVVKIWGIVFIALTGIGLIFDVLRPFFSDIAFMYDELLLIAILLALEIWLFMLLLRRKIPARVIMVVFHALMSAILITLFVYLFQPILTFLPGNVPSKISTLLLYVYPWISIHIGPGLFAIAIPLLLLLYNLFGVYLFAFNKDVKALFQSKTEPKPAASPPKVT